MLLGLKRLETGSPLTNQMFAVESESAPLLLNDGTATCGLSFKSHHTVGKRESVGGGA